MSVREKNGHWYTEFMCAGKRISCACENCKTRKQAEAFEKKLRETYKGIKTDKTVKALVENHKRELTGGGEILLTDAFDAYLKKPARRHAGPQKERANRRHWEDFVAFMKARYCDVIRLDQVSQSHAAAYIDHLRKHGRFIPEVRSKLLKHSDSYIPQKKQLSDTTINAYHTHCKAVFRRLAGDAGVVTNPFDFDTMDAKAETREVFTSDELKLINDSLPSNPFCRPLFIIGANTGLPLGDVCTLKWAQIKGNFIVRPRNKTGAQLNIPIFSVVRKLLQDLRLMREQLPESERSEYILPEQAQMYSGKNRSGVSRRIRRFLSGIGIETTRETGGARRASVKDFHSLRHTFAYLACINNIPIPIVQGILGHGAAKMTEHYLAHASREETLTFMRQFPSLVGNPENSDDELADEASLRQEATKLLQELPIAEVRAFLQQHRSQGL